MELSDGAATSASASNNNDIFAVPAGRIRKRRFSSARIQPTRVKKVMQSDEEIGRMVASVPVALGSAMEHFAEKLLEAAAQCVHFSSARTLTPSHMRYAILANRHFAFLHELTAEIPVARPASDVEPCSSNFNDPQVTSTSASVLRAPPLCAVPQAHNTFAEPQLLDLNPTSRQIFPASQQLIPQSILQTGSVITQSSFISPEPSEGEAPVKRKRGRPRKERKDKFIDAENAANDGNSIPNSIVDIARQQPAQRTTPEQDRVLMPPPSITIAGRTRRAAFLRSKTGNVHDSESPTDSPPPKLAAV